MNVHFLFLVILGLSFANCSDLPTVQIPDGKIQGVLSKSYGGSDYSAFFGIPYAKPPIGAKRFEEPVPTDPWPGTLMANKPTTCLQINHWPQPIGGKAEGQEDCLHINVYAPGKKINPSANLDVIVHIHGGAFMFGSGDAYAGPKYIIDQDIIYVTFNYRVGVLGFLSTGDEYLPGNLGMKDQVLALKWIKNNIQHFGGNPGSITITGLSAGGASVHYHLLSPLSRNLFNRAISASGCALNAWTFQEKPMKQAKKIGKAVGCDMDCPKKLVECLKTRTGEQLNEATRSMRNFLFNPFSPLALVVDSSSKNPFLPQHPYELLIEGKVFDVPWIASATADEGLYPAAEFAVSEKNFEKMDKDWNSVAPAIMHYEHSASKKQMDEISEKIRQKYMGDKEINLENFKPLIQMIGDRLFVADLELAARLHSKAIKAPVVFYHYNHTAEKIPTLAKWFTGSDENYGVCHGDDMMLVFNYEHQDKQPTMSKDDEKMKDTLIGIWISFAQHGVPKSIAEWQAVNKKGSGEFEYLYINDGVKMKSAVELGHRSFWESLPLNENANLLKKEQKKKTEL